jgi:hypothetical protein
MNYWKFAILILSLAPSLHWPFEIGKQRGNNRNKQPLSKNTAKTLRINLKKTPSAYASYNNNSNDSKNENNCHVKFWERDFYYEIYYIMSTANIYMKYEMLTWML